MSDILDSFLKAYQLANFIKHSRLQEQMDLQRAEELRQEREYQRQLRDFNIRSSMLEAGAQEVQPIGEIQPGFGSDWLRAGKRQQITAPGGTTYQVPTFEERQQRLLDKIRVEGEAKAGIAVGQAAAIERARQEVRKQYEKDPNLHFITRAIGEDLVTVGLDPQTGEERSRQVEKGGAKGAGANVRVDHYTDPETGTRVTEIRDPKTGELIREERKQGAITPRKSRSTAQSTGLSTGARLMMTAAQKAIDAAKGQDDESKKQEALGQVQQAVLAYPDELEGGEGDGGWPYIKPKAKAQAAAPAAARPTITRAEYNEAVKRFGKAAADAEVKRRGLEIIE